MNAIKAIIEFVIKLLGQFIAMLYAQLSGCHSFRHLEPTFNSHGNYQYQLGVKGIRRSTLADANKKRPLGLYKELLYLLLSQLNAKTANDLGSSTQELMALYKQRWQVELFFKWGKQNLKINRFYGTSEHALYLQVLIAMIAYLLLKLLNNSLSMLQVLLQKLTRLIAANLFQRKSIIDLVAFANQKRKPDKLTSVRQLWVQFG